MWHNTSFGPLANNLDWLFYAFLRVFILDPRHSTSSLLRPRRRRCALWDDDSSPIPAVPIADIPLHSTPRESFQILGVRLLLVFVGMCTSLLLMMMKKACFSFSSSALSFLFLAKALLHTHSPWPPRGTTDRTSTHFAPRFVVGEIINRITHTQIETRIMPTSTTPQHSPLDIREPPSTTLQRQATNAATYMMTTMGMKPLRHFSTIQIPTQQ